MKNIIIYSLSIFAFTFSSCNKFLEEVPSDFVAPVNYYKNEKEVYSALAGVYDILGKTSTYGRYLFFEYDISDQGYTYFSATQDIGLYNYDIGDVKLIETWSTLYEGINRANLLLENIDKATMSPNLKEVYKGEALFLRAYYHFVLTSLWGEVPLRLKAVTDPSDVDLQPSKLATIYQQIVSDMEIAAEKVNPVTSYAQAGRVSKSTIWGILARVNLKMAGHPLQDKSRFAEAKKWAQKVIDLGFHRLNPDYSQVFKNHSQKVYDLKESIWEVEFSYISGSQNEEGRVGVINGILATSATLGSSTGSHRAVREYYNIFENNDKRRDWNITNYTYATTSPVSYTYYTGAVGYNRYVAKWRREFEISPAKSTYTSIINFPLLRYSDVLLMYAEADNKLTGSRSSESDDYVNMVRRRAFGKLEPGATNVAEYDIATGLDEDDFHSVIQAERSKELGYEALRKFDLVRWGNFVLTMQNLATYFTVVPTTLQPGFRVYQNVTAKDTLMAIPRDEITVNKLMIQNKGW